MKCKILLVLLLSCSVAFAQESLDASTDSVRKEAALNNIEGKLFTPFSSSALSNFVSNINISSFFKEGVNGKIEIRQKFKEGWTGGLSVDQKIGGSDQEAMPLSLTGISPGTTIQINIQKMIWTPGFNMLSDNQIEMLNEVEKKFAARNNINDFRTVSLRDISTNGTEAEKRMALKAFDVAFQEPIFINARLGFTKTSFNYSTDSVNLSMSSDAYITPTFTASIVKALGSGFRVAGYVALSYTYSQYYLGGNTYTLNVPFGNTPNFYSTTLSFGKPSRQTDNNITAEYRRNIYFKRGGDHVSNIAISPSANYGIDSKMLGVFLPVYFIKGADENGKLLNNLQGGIRFGYITNTESGIFASFNKGFIAQLIISAPLDFLDVL